MFGILVACSAGCAPAPSPGSDDAPLPSPSPSTPSGGRALPTPGGILEKKKGVGDACSTGADCVSDSCITGVCRSASSSDGRKNGDETDVDCGGLAASACALGRACSADHDCRTRNCDEGVCQSGDPANAKRDGYESDVDCGGIAAPGCAVGGACVLDADCASAACVGGACVGERDDDGRRNGEETDVDCGGPTAPACDSGRKCLISNDCGGGACLAGTCAAATASDGLRNGDETDVDCGGASGRDCGDGQACEKDADCTSRACVGAQCVAPSADDGRKNGDETDVDCGGSSGKSCLISAHCAVDADCQSAACGADGRCKDRVTCTEYLGGETCGAGEIGDPNAIHESCCTEIPVVRAGPGGNYHLDKYQITAGRMRTALKRTNGDLRGWVQAHRPAWFGPENDVYLPSNWEEAHWLLGASQLLGAADGTGCFRAYGGGSTFWKPQDAEAANGDILSIHSREELDPKVLNCAYPAMLAAVCAMDGKRLPTAPELLFAWSGGDATRPWPWGAVGSPPTTRNDWGNPYAVHQYNYKNPNRNSPTNEDTAFLPPPGRKPAGYGPFGHADLVGALFDVAVNGVIINASGSYEMHLPQSQLQTGTFRTAEIATYPGSIKLVPSRRYHAFGSRCARAAAPL